jgi:hypothetical protein
MRLGADLQTLVMKITEKENILLRRALDPASSPNEAAKAAEAFVTSLRKRGLNGYDFVRPARPEPQQGPQTRPCDASPPPPQPPPPQQRAYEQATEPEPTRWTSPPVERESSLGRWIGSWLYRIAFFGVFGLISHQCSQQHQHQNLVGRVKSYDEFSVPTNSADPALVYHKATGDLAKVRPFSYWIDPQGNKVRIPPPIGWVNPFRSRTYPRTPVPMLYYPIARGFVVAAPLWGILSGRDLNSETFTASYRRALTKAREAEKHPLGSQANPYPEWQVQLPDYSYYYDYNGRVRQKLPII